MKLKMEIGVEHLYVTDALTVVMQLVVNSTYLYHVIRFFPVFLKILLGCVWQEQKEGQ